MKKIQQGGVRHLLYKAESFLGFLFVVANQQIFKKQFKRYLKKLNIDPNRKIEGEDIYVKKWSKFGSNVDIYSYRLFSRYCGTTPNIVPEAIGRCFIEPVLNPVRYRDYYSDKNLYNQYLPADYLPRSFVRRINGGVLINEDYKIITSNAFDVIPTDCNALILKYSVDSSSGKGVKKLIKKDNLWLDSDTKKVFSESDLKAYGDDWVLQEAIIQHPFMSRLCCSAVNTLRLTVYKSVEDDSVHVISSILRIGKNGAFVDNAHAGGAIVGINVETGQLNNYLTDQYGSKFYKWNDVNFAIENFTVPKWYEIKHFAEEIGRSNHHLRLLALDVSIDKNGNPILVEYNCIAFGYWVFMFNGFTPFEDYTDEIIEYCSNQNARQCLIQC